MDELKFLIGEEGIFREYKEPYCVIECPEKEDYDHIVEMVERGEKMRWIPVSERLPDRTMPPRDVLVYHDLGCGMFIDRAWYSYDKKRWCSVLGMKLKVTHWMPLPEPPEVDHDPD
jgi:hypothetical protein